VDTPARASTVTTSWSKPSKIHVLGHSVGLLAGLDLAVQRYSVAGT